MSVMRRLAAFFMMLALLLSSAAGADCDLELDMAELSQGAAGVRTTEEMSLDLAGSAEGALRDAEEMSLDLTDCAEGLVRVRAAESEKKLKLRIGYGDVVLTEDQNTDGAWQEYRLWFGSGIYTFSLYENVSGKMYQKQAEETVEICCDSLSNRLQPNEHVPFSDDAEIVRITDKLCADTDNPEVIFNRICRYMKKHFVFDYITVYKLGKVDHEILPDIDRLLQTGMGVCKDLSAVAVAMLRSQGIPAVLAYGYGDGSPHAWVIADLGGRQVLYDPTAVITGQFFSSYRVMKLF